MIRHFSHIFFAEGLTFIGVPSWGERQCKPWLMTTVAELHLGKRLDDGLSTPIIVSNCHEKLRPHQEAAEIG